MDAQTIICTNCQTPNPAKNLYCQACGKPLVQAPSRPVAPSVSTTPPADADMTQAPSAARVLPPSPVPIPYPSQSQEAPQAEGQPFPMAMPSQPQPVAPQVEPEPQVYTPPAPAQPVYYAPPPPPPPPPSPTLEKLGVRTDSWSDLISGAGDKADEVTQSFLASIKEREIPQTMVESVGFSSGLTRKSYQVVRCSGGTIAVKIAAVGKDLSIAWSLYTPRILNWPMLGILAAIAFGVSLLTSLNLMGNFGYFFVGWVFGTFRWLLDTAILAMIAGYVWKGSLWYFFLVDQDEFARDELKESTMAVHAALLAAVEITGLDSTKLRSKSF